MKRILTIPVLRSLGVVGALLFPLALNAMQKPERWEEDYLESISPRFFAEIIDNNKQEFPRKIAAEDGYIGFGNYAVRSTWSFNDLAKIITATYTVKKDAQTLVHDTTAVNYDTAFLRRLDAEAYLRISVHTRDDDRQLPEVMHQEQALN